MLSNATPLRSPNARRLSILRRRSSLSLTPSAVGVEDLNFAYALYAGDPSNESSTRVASFREGRIGYRLWATRTGRINPSVEDRLDHDVDELMA
jgi:hypothetical protein